MCFIIAGCQQRPPKAIRETQALSDQQKEHRQELFKEMLADRNIDSLKGQSASAHEEFLSLFDTRLKRGDKTTYVFDHMLWPGSLPDSGFIYLTVSNETGCIVETGVDDSMY